MYGFRLIADRLSYRDDPDTVLGQLPKVKLLFESFAKEPAIAVDYNNIERVFTITCPFDHLLKDRTAIVAGRSAGLNEFANDRVPICDAPRPELTLLIWN